MKKQAKIHYENPCNGELWTEEQWQEYVIWEQKRQEQSAQEDCHDCHGCHRCEDLTPIA